MSQILGLDVQDLPEGWTPLEAVAVVKCLSADGLVTHSLRASEGCGDIEGVGMLTAGLDLVRRDVLASVEHHGGDDD